MRTPPLLAPALLAPALLALGLATGSAQAAGICRSDHLTCATNMPVGGYCECTARGSTEGGTVEARPAPGNKVNSTSGGCGSQPNSPGCRR